MKNFGKPYEGEPHVRIDEEVLAEAFPKPELYSTSPKAGLSVRQLDNLPSVKTWT